MGWQFDKFDGNYAVFSRGLRRGTNVVIIQAGKYEGMQGVILKRLPKSGMWGLKLENGKRVPCSEDCFQNTRTKKEHINFKRFHEENKFNPVHSKDGFKIEFMIKSEWREAHVDSQSHAWQTTQGYFRIENLMTQWPTKSEKKRSGRWKAWGHE